MILSMINSWGFGKRGNDDDFVSRKTTMKMELRYRKNSFGYHKNNYLYVVYLSLYQEINFKLN